MPIPTEVASLISEAAEKYQTMSLEQAQQLLDENPDGEPTPEWLAAVCKTAEEDLAKQEEFFRSLGYDLGGATGKH